MPNYTEPSIVVLRQVANFEINRGRTSLI